VHEVGSKLTLAVLPISECFPFGIKVSFCKKRLCWLFSVRPGTLVPAVHRVRRNDFGHIFEVTAEKREMGGSSLLTTLYASFFVPLVASATWSIKLVFVICTLGM
jgi:hypothetical protein